MKFSIRFKIIFIVFCVITLLGILTAGISYQKTKQQLLEIETNNLINQHQSEQREIEQIFSFSSDLVKQIAFHDHVVSFLSIEDHTQESRTQVTQEILSSYNIGDMYSAIYLIDTTGLTVASTDPSFVGKNYGFRDYVTIALSGTPYIDVSLGVTSKQLGYYFSYPVVNAKQEIIGIAVIKMKPTIFDGIFDALASSERKSLITDTYGVIVHTTKKDQQFNSLGFLPIESLQSLEEKRRYEGMNIIPTTYDTIQQKLSSISHMSIFDIKETRETEKEIAIVTPLKELPFYLVTHISVHTFSAIAAKNAQLMVLFIFIMSAISMILIYLFLIKILKPLRVLQQATKHISEGDFSQLIPIESQDEIGQLTQSFNSMIQALSDTQQHIQQKIAQQTTELNQTKNILEKKEKDSITDVEDKQFIKSILDNSPSVIFAKDLEGKYLMVNKKYEELFHITKKDIIGKTDDDIFPKELAEAYKQNDQQVAKEKKMLMIEEQAPDKKKHLHSYLTIKFPLLNEKNDIIGIGGIATDITTQKKNEQTLQKTIKELQMINKAMEGRELKIIELKKEIEQLKKPN